MTRASLLSPVLVLALAAGQVLPPALAQDSPPADPPTEAPTGTTTPTGQDAAPQPPPPFERWRYNPRERTRHGLERLDAGDAMGAAESFGTAGRLAEDDPVAQFNAGTAGLLAGVEDAAEHLALAAEAAGPELAPSAHFNLGNARLAAGDAGGAIEAYKSSLRLDPANRDVKHNLELALQAQQQQQQEQQQQQQQEQQQQEQQRQQEQQQQEQQDEPGEDGEQEDRQEQQPPPNGEPPDQPPDEQKLPDFADQPDMSAEQAAAILEAVENLERDERRRQAAERARKQSKKGKDW